MSLFESTKLWSGLVVLHYGVLLSICPEVVFGFIYRDHLWVHFVPKDPTGEKILDHILTCFGYSCVAWSLMYVMETTNEKEFAQYNVMVWTMFSILDMVTRFRGLYYLPTSLFNLVVINSILAGWIRCIV